MPRVSRDSSLSAGKTGSVSLYRLPSDASAEPITSEEETALEESIRSCRNRTAKSATKASATKRPTVKQALEELESVRKETQHLRRENQLNTKNIAHLSAASASKGQGNSRDRRSHISVSSARSVLRISASPELPGRSTSVFDGLGSRYQPYNQKPACAIPSVSSKMAKKLAHLSEFIEFAELLPLNRPSTVAASGMKFGVKYEINAIIATPNIKRELISRFETWCRAYFCFMTHRVFHFPQYTMPMLKYLDIISGFAKSQRNHSTAQWLNYDRMFRTFAAVNPDQPELWAHRHEDTYQE